MHKRILLKANTAQMLKHVRTSGNMKQHFISSEKCNHFFLRLLQHYYNSLLSESNAAPTVLIHLVLDIQL